MDISNYYHIKCNWVLSFIYFIIIYFNIYFGLQGLGWVFGDVAWIKGWRQNDETRIDMTVYAAIHYIASLKPGLGCHRLDICVLVCLCSKVMFFFFKGCCENQCGFHKFH